jgi:serine/threonine protein kinase
VIQIDFGCATQLQEETEQASTSLQNVYGTLAYVSPEQTGRINRTIDYRTDFYSLVIFYLCN